MKMKKIAALFLCVAMLMSALVTTAMAAGSNMSVSSTASVEAGETVTVTVSNDDMTVSTFIGRIYFDTSKLEFVSVSTPTLTLVGGSTVAADDYTADATLVNANGFVGFGWASLSNKDYAAAPFATITFKAKAGTAGTAAFSIYEDSAGADGKELTDVSNLPLGSNTTITAPAPTTYTVSFDSNGGSGTMADVTGVSGNYTLPACTFTAPAGSGATFKGWATSANGTVITGTSINVTSDIILYAIWEGGTGGPIDVTGVSLNKNTMTLTVGGSETLTATVAPSNATNKAVTWSSSNPAVATVVNGKVTAVSAGTAIITVTTADGGKTATCAVTVNAGGGNTPTPTPTPPSGGGHNTHFDYNNDGKCDYCGYKTVESSKTFDAGIALYAGMAVLAATGSAVVLKKKKD